MTANQPSTLGKRLDLHHDAEQTGPLAECAVCRVSTDDGFVSGLRHNPQPDELDLARGYLRTYSARSV